MCRQTNDKVVMHTDVVAALQWSNGQARNKLLRKLYKNNTISEDDFVKAKLVLQIRKKLYSARNSLASQDEKLKDLRSEHELSRTQFKELCRMARVCVADGNWYSDLAQRLCHRSYQVNRKQIKQYSHLKLCMLNAM